VQLRRAGSVNGSPPNTQPRAPNTSQAGWRCSPRRAARTDAFRSVGKSCGRSYTGRSTANDHQVAWLFRQSAGPGWVPVCDTGHFKDPAPGLGIADALRQAMQLADSISTGIRDGSLDEALQSWWCWRDDGAYEMYRFARLVGRRGKSSPLATQGLISRDKEATRDFFLVFSHEGRPSQVFRPARSARAAMGVHRYWAQAIGGGCGAVRCTRPP
jgi:2-polyprenyl-6-methoxyphenol hydroxylase-like FAD-dependent oxidoreductase